MGAEDLHEINHLRAEMMQLMEQGNALLAAAVLEKSQELDKLISAYLQRKCDTVA